MNPHANVYNGKEPVIIAAPVPESGIGTILLRAYYESGNDRAMVKADYDVFQSEEAALAEAGRRIRECQKS